MNKITNSNNDTLVSLYGKEVFLCDKCMIYNGKYHLFTGNEGKIEVYNNSKRLAFTLLYNNLNDLKEVLRGIGFSIRTI